jgi:hypothetical protein
MSGKRNAIRKKKQKRQKKRREGKTTEAELARRKKQAEEEYIMEEEETETELTSSEDYESGANDALAAGDTGEAQVLATLALTATIRESVFILAEILDPDGGDEE